MPKFIETNIWSETAVSCARTQVLKPTMPHLLSLLCIVAPTAAGLVASSAVAAAPCTPRATAICAGASDGSGSSGGGSGREGLPTARVRAPRRLRQGAGSGAATRRDGGARRGGSLGPKGKAAVAARPQGKSAQLRELQRLVITGGSARGRRLVTPGVYMRPMMSRVREALFSMLYPTGVLRDSASHLDLFAGSGVVGLEALSRGVGEATFVDF